MATTELGAPMELLGVQPGVSVIDPSTVLTRLWYFDGKFLRAEDFRKDQEYVRSLVALSNQAIGTGVVQGFDARLAGGDKLAVDAGLGIAPSGRVVHLPSNVDVSIATLIARSSGVHLPGDPGEAGPASFEPCPPDIDPNRPDIEIASRPVYVLTVAPAEALCGEEERFGKLCEDACATDTDRSVAVEGVLFRVRPLNLNLKTSTAVPFDGSHFRSRVAWAYFEAERRAIASGISGAGLRSDAIWCHGAEGIGGDEIPLAVFDRQGSVTSMLDMWTARRELMESTPQRYWSRRFAMRPLDVFLAQVLHFQCHLLDLAAPTERLPGDDPCEDQRRTLADVGQLLTALTTPPDAFDDAVAKGTFGASALRDASRAFGLAEAGLPEGALARLADLKDQVGRVLDGGLPIPAGGDSILLARGIACTSAAGYVPLNPERGVEAQVRALFGSGVDLRFCAVRPDFIPEALQEAQHMDPISLTQGIDDPSNLEEVDVLVPGGSVVEHQVETHAFEGRLDLLPATRKGEEGLVEVSALSLATVAREHVGDSWSWSMAAHAEVPHDVAIATLVDAMAAEVGGIATAEESHAAAEEAAAADAQAILDAAADAGVVDAAVEAEVAAEVAAEEIKLLADLKFTDTSDHAEFLAKAGFHQRMRREHHLAKDREEYLRAVYGAGDIAALADRAVPNDERRPLSLWLDVETDNLADVSVGDVRPLRARLSGYSRAATSPVVGDLQITGTLRIDRKTPMVDQNGVQAWSIETTVSGTSDTLLIVGANVADPPPRPIQNINIVWSVRSTAAGAQLLTATVVRLGRPILQFNGSDIGSPRRIEAGLERATFGVGHHALGDLKRYAHASATSAMVRVAGLAMTESPGALDLGATGRDLGEAVIDVIAAELLNRDRDRNFGTYARRRLLAAAQPADTSGIEAATDWVMFHRRRTKVCAGPVVVATPTRRYRWYHATIDDDAGLKAFAALAGRWSAIDDAAIDLNLSRLAGRVDDLGFEVVTDVEYLATSSQPSTPAGQLLGAFGTGRGDALRLALVSDPLTGDGTHVARGRLDALTSVIAGAIDTSNLESREIGSVPPEFQSVGIDGAMFTIGVSKPKETLARAVVLRGSPQLLKVLADAIASDGGDFDEDVLTEVAKALALEIGDDSLGIEDAFFSGPNFSNEAAISAWMQPYVARTAVYGYNPTTLGDLTEMNAWESDRRSGMLRALGQPALQGLPETIRWTSQTCDAVYLASVVPRQYGLVTTYAPAAYLHTGAHIVSG